MKTQIQDIFTNWLKEEDDFSGVFSVSDVSGVVYQHATGYRNIAEQLPNTVDTAFGIASGTKLFTGLAVCKLIDDKKLSPDDKLCDLLPQDLGQIDKRITVFHLLTHTSGVGDYIDEDADDMEEKLQALYDTYPVQLWDKLEYYLQMSTHLPPKFEPGERFGYSNSGYVLLGLVVEAVSGVPFQKFVQDVIFTPCNLTHTGFYRLDSLPANTALGYMENGRTNAYSLPIRGGSDGGLYTCAADLDKLWRAIFANKILSEDITKLFLQSHVEIDDEETYGLGVYHYKDGDKLLHYAVGVDSGVGFATAYYPKTGVVVSGLKNTGYFPWSFFFEELLEVLG